MPSIIQFIKSQFLPGECFLCKKSADISLSLCQSCISDLAENSCCCSLCANPLNSSVEYLLDDSPLLCGKCQKHKSSFDQVFSPFLYQEDMVKLIYQFKYGGKLYMGKTLAELFLQQVLQKYKLNNNISFPELIVPVPLHLKRLKHRGFNQANEVAQYLSKKMSIKLDNTLVERIKLTHTQRGLNLKQRKANLKDAFAKTDKNFTQKHVVLVDDVMTTGNTVNEVAKLLKQAGAKQVDVWTIARA
jgi:ComF family protein